MALAAALIRAPFQLGLVSVGQGDGQCPNRPLHARPVAFHFEPGLDQHRSWIEAPIPEPDATDFVLCLDGKLVAEHIGETLELGWVHASVRTSWVDLQWLLGALNLHEDPERWDLGYTTYTLNNRGVLNPG